MLPQHYQDNKLEICSLADVLIMSSYVGKKFVTEAAATMVKINSIYQSMLYERSDNIKWESADLLREDMF